MTDRFSVDFQFSRVKLQKAIEDQTLEMNDRNIDKVSILFRHLEVHPEIANVFTAAYGHGDDDHGLRGFTTCEYDTLTGSARRKHALNKEKQATDIKDIESFSDCQDSKARAVCGIPPVVSPNRQTLFCFHGLEERG